MSNQDRFRKGPASAPDHWEVPVASGTVVSASDLMKLSSGKAVAMATTTDNLTFVGPALHSHASTDASGTMNVGKPNGMDVYEYDLNTATDVTLGDLFQWNAAQKLKKSTTAPIFLAVESKLAATKIRGVFLIPAKTDGLQLVGDAS